MTDANYTLSTANGSTDEARNMMVNMTGALTAGRNVVCPTAEKLYVFRNATTGGFSLTLKTSGGTGIVVASGNTAILYCDGTNVLNAIVGINIAAGGTNGTATPTAGAIAYGTGTAYAFSSAGTTGQVALSGGTGSPTFTTGTLTLAGNLATSGASALTLTTAGATNVTLPTTGTLAILGANTFTGTQNFGNQNLSALKTAAFNSEISTGATSGTINVDWTAGACYLQAEPTNSVTYTFTAPTNSNVKLQIRVASDGTSTARTFTFPATVRQYGSTWTGTVTNKAALITLWWDGTSYHTMVVNEA